MIVEVRRPSVSVSQVAPVQNRSPHPDEWFRIRDLLPAAWLCCDERQCQSSRSRVRRPGTGNQHEWTEYQFGHQLYTRTDSQGGL